MIHLLLTFLQVIAILGCISSSAYYLLCLWSAYAFVRKSKQSQIGSAPWFPPISVLKPLKGTDPEMYESFRSHCLQDYPEYEIIFGVSHAADPAAGIVEQLQQEFPDRAIRLVVCAETLGPNVKVSNLEQMVQASRFQFLIVNDSDIRVESDYLRRVVAPLAAGDVGLVTCLYRGVAAATLGSELEAIGISTDFCPGVLVAQQFERGLHFGLGSTLAFRRNDLERIGGFRALVDFLADDYELGRRISALPKKVVLSDVIVETHLPEYDLIGFLSHQLRWFRGIRDARYRGYVGLVSTFGVMWALLALLFARGAPWSWAVLGAVFLLRTAVALVFSRAVLQDEDVAERLWLVPLRDLIAVGVWIASFTGHTVIWREERFKLKNGRLLPLRSQSFRGDDAAMGSNRPSEKSR
jgi:ceramide glucosyltransferase